MLFLQTIEMSSAKPLALKVDLVCVSFDETVIALIALLLFRFLIKSATASEVCSFIVNQT